jgi:hypothetical protein
VIQAPLPQQRILTIKQRTARRFCLPAAAKVRLAHCLSRIIRKQRRQSSSSLSFRQRNASIHRALKILKAPAKPAATPLQSSAAEITMVRWKGVIRQTSTSLKFQQSRSCQEEMTESARGSEEKLSMAGL